MTTPIDIFTTCHDLVVQKTDTGSYYCRSMSSESMLLCNELEKCYPSRQNVFAIVVPSGMASISVCLNTIIREHIREKLNIIHGDELYCDTPRLIKYVAQIHPNCNVQTFNVNDNDTLVDITKKEINVLFVESATNPSGDIFDFSIIPTLRKKSKKLYVIVDNTWLTHVVFNPFYYDIDICVTSLTKYYSGGFCIAGAIICKKKYHQILFDYVRRNGLHVSPIHCKLIVDKMANMEQRITTSSNNTVVIAKYLETQNCITSVRHASLECDPSHSKAQKYFESAASSKIYPSVISFVISMNVEDAKQWMNNRSNIKYETSFGSGITKFDPWPQKIDETHTLCRLAIGYDDNIDDIMQDLQIQQ